MPITVENIESIVSSVIRQREAVLVQQLNSNFEILLARSLETLRTQLYASAIPSNSSTSVTPAHPLHGPQPNQPQNVDPTPSSPLSTNSLASVPQIEKVTKVPRAEYTKTSTQSSDSLAKNTITHQSQDSKKKMALLDSILNTEYLLSLFNDSRSRPVCSADNPYGYSPNSISIDSTGAQTIIKADDVFHYDYDLKRSFQLLLIVFTESLHYICKPDILAGNSIAIYKAMYKHLFGKQTSDVQRETAKLDNHKVDFRLNLRQNIDILEQLITNVEHASDRKFTNKERNQLITIKFADDTRRGHSAIFVATGVSVDDYYERIAKIIQHTDDLADIHSSRSTGKIAAVVAGAPTEKCRAYTKYGNCPRGTSCPYLHDPTVTPRNPKDNKDKGKKDWSKNKTPPAAVRPAYTVISKKHRAAVGPARGVISKFNPEGYDDSQVLHIQQLQINAAYSIMRQAEKTGEAWLPQDPTSYPAATDTGVQFQINMMSASAPTVNTDIASDDEDDAELPLIDAFDASRTNNPLSNNRTIGELTEGLVEIQRVLTAYTDTLRDFTGSTRHTDAIMWVYRERYQGGTIHQPYPNAPVVLLFNWVQQHDTIRTLSPLRADIKNGAPRAMRLLYSIGKWFLNADVTIPMPTSRKPTTTYQTGAFPAFQPQTFPLHQSEFDGLYKSTVTSVMTYFDFFEQLQKIKAVYPETIQFVVLAMLLDFMAFVAQKLRQHCGSEWTQEELQQGRIALQMEINTIDAWDPSPIPKDGWALTLCGIVANSGPLTTFNDANPWECTHPVPSENALYKDLVYSPEIYGHRPQFRRAKKLISPPPRPPSDDEPTEFDSPPAALSASRKRARPPSSPSVMALRSPVRLTMPAATPEQLQRWSHPESPTAYLSPSRHDISTFFPPPDDNVQSTSSSSSHPPRAESADLKVFCAIPSGTIAAITQTPKRLMWDSGANRSGTGSKAGLRNITACPPLSIQGAFGPPIQPTHRGELGPMKLETVVIDGMGDNTIISVSQVCKLGYIAVFNDRQFKVYKADTIKNALKVLDLEGKAVAYGKVENGLYYQESN